VRSGERPSILASITPKEILCIDYPKRDTEMS
jgi:hypothetical protein